MNDNEKVEELEDQIREINADRLILEDNIIDLEDELTDQKIKASELRDECYRLSFINKSYESESIEMRVAQMITCLSDIDLVQNALDKVRRRMVI